MKACIKSSEWIYFKSFPAPAKYLLGVAYLSISMALATRTQVQVAGVFETRGVADGRALMCIPCTRGTAARVELIIATVSSLVDKFSVVITVLTFLETGRPFFASWALLCTVLKCIWHGDGFFQSREIGAIVESWRLGFIGDTYVFLAGDGTVLATIYLALITSYGILLQPLASQDKSGYVLCFSLLSSTLSVGLSASNQVLALQLMGVEGGTFLVVDMDKRCSCKNKLWAKTRIANSVADFFGEFVLLVVLTYTFDNIMPSICMYICFLIVLCFVSGLIRLRCPQYATPRHVDLLSALVANLIYIPVACLAYGMMPHKRQLPWVPAAPMFIAWAQCGIVWLAIAGLPLSVLCSIIFYCGEADE